MENQKIIVSEINIDPIKPSSGLVGFASCVINNSIFLGSIGIHKRLDGSGYRITYPTKKIGRIKLNYFHPINSECGKMIETAIVMKCITIFEKSDENYDRYSQTCNSDK